MHVLANTHVFFQASSVRTLTPLSSSFTVCLP